MPKRNAWSLRHRFLAPEITEGEATTILTQLGTSSSDIFSRRPPSAGAGLERQEPLMPVTSFEAVRVKISDIFQVRRRHFGGGGPSDCRGAAVTFWWSMDIEPSLDLIGACDIFCDRRRSHRVRVPHFSTGLMSTTGVPSMASIAPMRRRLPSIDRTVTGWRPNGFGLSGDRVAKTPVSRLRASDRGWTWRTSRWAR